MEAKVYSQTGKEIDQVKLPANIFGLPWNADLVHQVVISMEGNARTPVAHAKNRGEVSGTGKKPWKQKGTGRARHGSTRSPIWVGGGVTHGPRKERDYSRKINKKMKTKALFTVLSKKFKDGEVIFIDELSFREPKTKEAKKVLSSISKIKEYGSVSRKKNAAFIALPSKSTEVLRSFNNFGNLEIGQMKDLNVLDILRYKNLIVAEPEKSLEILTAKSKK
jgi:large subunit ribosomal protein L4